MKMIISAHSLPSGRRQPAWLVGCGASWQGIVCRALAFWGGSFSFLICTLGTIQRASELMCTKPKRMVPTSQEDSSKCCSHPYPTSSSLINSPQHGSREEVLSWFRGYYCHPLNLRIPMLGLGGGPLPSFILCYIAKSPVTCGEACFHMPQFPYLYNVRKQGPLPHSGSE